MIMKFYNLGSLRELISQKGVVRMPDSKWSSKLAISLAIDCVGALRVMHEVGIVHNDIKVTILSSLCNVKLIVL